MKRFALAIAVMLSASAAVADESVPTFEMPGGTFNAPLPMGYCAATGSFEAWAKVLASVDTSNLTDISYVACSDLTPGNTRPTTWGMIKTPLSTLREMAGPRQAELASLQATVNQDEGKKVQEVTTAELAQNSNMNAIFGPDFKGSARFDAMDFDDYGIYYGGVSNFDDGKGDVHKIACAYSITVANGRVFAIYLYRAFNDVSDIAALLALTKTETKAFIVANGG